MPLNNCVSPHCTCENRAGGCSRSSIPGHSFPVSTNPGVPSSPNPILLCSYRSEIPLLRVFMYNIGCGPGTPFLLLGLPASNLFQSSVQYKFTDHQPTYSVQHCQRGGSTMRTEQAGQCSQRLSV